MRRVKNRKLADGWKKKLLGIPSFPIPFDSVCMYVSGTATVQFV